MASSARHDDPLPCRGRRRASASTGSRPTADTGTTSRPGGAEDLLEPNSRRSVRVGYGWSAVGYARRPWPCWVGPQVTSSACWVGVEYADADTPANRGGATP